MNNNSSSQNIKEIWALGDYKRLGSVISSVSAHLVGAVQVKEGEQVLDMVCDYGNTAITARQKDGKVTGIDITSELLTLVIKEESITKVSGITWKEGNIESYHLKIRYLMLFYQHLDTCLLLLRIKLQKKWLEY